MFRFSFQDIANDAFRSGFTAAVFRQIPKRISVPLFTVAVLVETPAVACFSVYLANGQDFNRPLQTWVLWGACVFGLVTHSCILAALCSGKGFLFVVADIVLIIAVIAGWATTAGWTTVA